ncbi:SDR family oxidoreductase [Euzebya tangerina]|uniref:SDR family oxidoreductase n=1 Tax=Euzebya tangerina TaxID=591198 RepID=UPI000E3242D7|nr:SDR family oxidoreductase [Euzebya tangerina]
MDPSSPLICVLGATGYVGGRLVPRLLSAGFAVRCLVRSPGKLDQQPWKDQVEVVRGDATVRADLDRALEGCEGVYHLVHQMGSAKDFASADRQAAMGVTFAAHAAGVKRIVYLGGLGEVDDDSSRHLASRGEVADILAAGPVPVTTLRAAVIIGSGSASFEMLRHLTEKLPVMTCPQWIETRVQPIAIRDVLRYLIAAMDTRDAEDHDIDIGGPEVMTYRQMMQRYAAVAGLRRRIIVTVPVLTPSLSSHWVNLMTPVPFGLARPLVESLTVDVVVRDGHEQGRDLDPTPCLPYDEAVRLALKRVADHEVETSWREADLAGRSPADPFPGDPDWAGGVLLKDVRSATARAGAEATFRAVTRIGGDRGWPTHQWAWTLRGLLDLAVGGVGLRRGRRDPNSLRPGDALDFWRVESVVPNQLVRLRAEMRLPGDAWLEFRLNPTESGTEIVQRGLLSPRGLLGRVYWWVLLPFHGPIFTTMVNTLAADAEAIQTRLDDGTAVITSTGAPTAPPEVPDGASRTPILDPQPIPEAG